MSEERKLPEISPRRLPEFNLGQQSPFIERTARMIARIGWKERFLDMLNRALAAAGMIEGADAEDELIRRILVIVKISRELAKVDVQRAIALFERTIGLAERIGVEWLRCDAFREIASRLAKVDPQRAIDLAERIEDKWEQSWELREIASEIAKVDIQRGLYLAERISNKEQRSLAHRQITEELAKVDIERAILLAEKIEDAYHRALAFVEIATAIWDRCANSSTA